MVKSEINSYIYGQIDRLIDSMILDNRQTNRLIDRQMILDRYIYIDRQRFQIDRQIDTYIYIDRQYDCRKIDTYIYRQIGNGWID